MSTSPGALSGHHFVNWLLIKRPDRRSIVTK